MCQILSILSNFEPCQQLESQFCLIDSDLTNSLNDLLGLFGHRHLYYRRLCFGSQTENSLFVYYLVVKMCMTRLPLNTSFDSIHRLAKRGTPTQMCNYKHALQLYKLFNSETMTEDWVSLNFQQQFNGRRNRFQFFTSSNYKVGNNLMVNRFRQLNNKIDYNWLNESFNSYKIKCKKLFLQ